MSKIFGEIFGKEKLNTGRQSEFDWAKAFAIIYMACIHVYEKMSVINSDIVPKTPFRLVMEFLAGPWAAPIFMFAMGVGMTYSRHSSPEVMAVRGRKLLVNGYLLNLFRNFIPLGIGWLLGMGALLPLSPIAGLLYIDILQFAGLAFLMIALMKKLNMKPSMMMVTALVLQVIGHYLSKIHFQSVVVRYVLSPFLLTHKFTSFPMLLWLFYPVLGLMYGEMLHYVKDKKKLYQWMFGIGVIGTVITTVIYRAVGIDIRTMFMIAGKTYYNQSILHYIWTCFTLMIALGLCYFLSCVVKVQGVVNVVKYLGNNLSTLYIIHWLVICYTIAVKLILGAPDVPQVLIVPVALVVLIVSVGICKVYKKIIGSKKK